ncbi:hypothetical protein [uncultured Parasphingorhabdus sp.]|uniref:hypothetical protein n=1 Tax=uncultured Parasphingorhabdus sp. TaxID=2709694 RepID=UPI002AA71D0F|nr:hypothetical protein [uncultured Parasphingorhabdus sp.]
MTFQDEFIHRLRVVRGEATGDGGEDSGPSTGSGRTDERESRHPEFISGPFAGEPEDRGVRDGVLKRVQDDEDSSGRGDENVQVQGGELTPPSRLRVSGRSVPRTDLELPGAVPPDTGPGVGLCETKSAAPDTPDIPTPSPSREREGDSTRHDGWHRELRVKFLEALAQTGNVQASAYFVQRSRQSAYDLKRRDPDFARAWLAALVLAREEAQDKLQERAIEGVEEEIFYHGEVVATRRRYDSRLLLAHLARLDKIAAQIPAQRGAARFGDMLDAIGKGEDTAPLIATPTEEELAIAAAAAETLSDAGPASGPGSGLDEADLPEFYALCDPDLDDAPSYYRMTPEEAAALERDCPGVTVTPTGIRSDAAVNALPWHREAPFEDGSDAAEQGIYL